MRRETVLFGCRPIVSVAPQPARPFVFLPASIVLLAAVFLLFAENVKQGPDSQRPVLEPRATVEGLGETTSGLTDRLGGGLPDAARLDRPEDREAFVRWLTYLAESQFYRPSREAAVEIRDCSSLIRFAYRNALVAHSAAWRESMGMAGQPELGDVQKFKYPNWILGSGLFRTRPGPFAPRDLTDGTFTQFADAAALLHYNAFIVSRDIRSARAGDILFYRQRGQAEPYHSMLFVGRSSFQPQHSDWVVYHTGDMNGRSGQVREVEAALLMRHPDPRWRPLAANPRFLGVYRFELLR